MSEVTDSTCHDCHRVVVLYVHEITVVDFHNGNRYRYECPNCGADNDHWLGDHTRTWLLSRGANHITVTLPLELLDVARDNGPWTSADMDPLECITLFSDADIWAELDRYLGTTDSGWIAWGDDE